MKRRPGNPDYSPMAKELKISEEHYFYLDEHNPDELNRLVDIFNQSALTRRAEREKNRLLNKSIINQAHWYKVLSDEARIKLIKESSSFMDEVIDEAMNGTKLPAMLRHYSSLKVRMQTGVIVLKPITDKKLVRFPEIYSNTNSLCGKGYRFVALWSHCYSDKIGKKGIGSKKFYTKIG